MVLLGFLVGLVLIHLWLRRKSERVRSAALLAYCALFIIVISFTLFYEPGQGVLGVLRTLVLSIYQAPMIMGFQTGLDEFSQLQYIIIFCIGSFYTLRTVLLLLLHKAVNALRLQIRIHLRKEIYLVFGELEDARALIEDIRRQAGKAAILYLDPSPDRDDDVLIDGALTVPVDYLDRLSPKKEYFVVLLPQRNHENLRMLRRLEALGEKLPQLHVTAFVDNELLRLEDLHLSHMDAWLVSQEQLVVRRYLNEHLPLRYMQEHGLGAVASGVYVPARPFSLAVIGFDGLSREFLLTTYENTAFETARADANGLQALIVSPDMSQCQGAFFRDYPQMREEIGLCWLEASPESDSLFTALEERLAELDQILINTGDTAANVTLALRLLRVCRRNGLEAKLPQLAVVLHEDAQGSVDLLKEEKNVFFLQANRTQYTLEELILRETDRQAMALHQRYQGKNKSIPDWRNLGTFTQASNRAVIWDIPNKLALAGDLSGCSGQERERILWRIAQYEHRRWNAFHYSRGWTLLPLSELTEEELAQHKTKRLSERRHICLVGWDELDALPQDRPGLLKFYDYENVVQLFGE